MKRKKERKKKKHNLQHYAPCDACFDIDYCPYGIMPTYKQLKVTFIVFIHYTLKVVTNRQVFLFSINFPINQFTNCCFSLC